MDQTVNNERCQARKNASGKITAESPVGVKQKLGFS